MASTEGLLDFAFLMVRLVPPFRLMRERMLTLEPTLSVVLEARKVATVFEGEVTFPVSLQAVAFG